VATDWSKDKVRPLFERVKDKHHQITIQAMDGVLKGAGL